MCEDTEKIGALTIKYVPDKDAESPRKWDNMGKMVCWHRRYELGDQHNFANFDEFTPPKDAIVLPLFLYDHSGLRIKVGSFEGLPQGHARFDSGQVGFIVADRAAICENFMCKRVTKKLRERVTRCLLAEVETYDKYLSGDVWGFEVTDEDGETLESCFGFYGREDVEEAARAAVSVLATDSERVWKGEPN